jgi:dCTP deaminase
VCSPFFVRDLWGREMIASGQTIRRLKPLSPLVERAKFGGMTYGLGPAGYDIRIAQTMRLLPGDFHLASSQEYFHMPNNLVGFVHDKSTWARMGLALQNTVIEPGWRGFLTLELSNHGSHLHFIKAGTPIAQIIFQLTDEPVERPYDGKYQDQAFGPVKAIMEEGK